MNVFLVWFGIAAFSALLLAFVLNIIRYSRFSTRQTLLYTVLLGVNCLWVTIYTYALFSEIFIGPLSEGMRTYLGILRTAVTAAVLVLIPVIVLGPLNRMGYSKQHTSKKLNNLSRSIVFQWTVIPAAACAYVVAVAVWFRDMNSVRSTVITVAFYGYLTSVVLYGLIRMKIETMRSKQTVYPINVRLYLLLVTILYPVTAVVHLPPILMLEPTLISTLPRSLFAFCWGVMEIVVFIKGERLPESGAIHRNAVEIFSLTPREEDVASRAVTGMTCKEIGEQLFISEKTVEAHLYNIYRKCDVKNRLELQRKLRSPV